VKVQRFLLVRKEGTHCRGNLGGVRLQREVPSIKKAHECIWNITLERLSTRRQEERIV